MPAGPDDLSLIVNGTAWSGWETVSVTRGVEICPSHFTLTVTERFPGQSGQIDVQPGQACQVKLGGDLVITGFVDRYSGRLSASEHSIHIQGRGRCADLVDCSAGITNDQGASLGGQIMASSALAVAQLVAKPYGITVTGSAGGTQIQPFVISLGETCYQLIERICRYAQLLAYEDTAGNLVLGQVGTTSMSSGFQQGVNVQEADVTFSMDERFSAYVAVYMNLNTLAQLGGADGNKIGVVNDPNIGRFRPHVIISEQLAPTGQSVALQRARWELGRRIGRSQAVRLTCDSWRDSAGKLWEPNSLVPVSLPALKLTPSKPWVIGEVSFIKDLRRGTVAEITIMPQTAFSPQPDVQLPFDWDIAKAIQDANKNTSSGAAGL